jgi:integrase/recombinase XerD
MRQKKLPIILNPQEVQKLLEQPRQKIRMGTRNFAIMKIILNCGLRISEAINLKATEIDLDNGKLKIVDGKGGKDRNLAIPEAIKENLKAWEKIKPKSEYFFPTKNGGKLGPRFLQLMIKRYSKSAKLNKNITPHSLRHIFATEFYRQTKDIETLRKILGHENISTTTIYITLANEEVEESMKRFKIF